mgnify:CR=1 FL=1
MANVCRALPELVEVAEALLGDAQLADLLVEGLGPGVGVPRVLALVRLALLFTKHN